MMLLRAGAIDFAIVRVLERSFFHDDQLGVLNAVRGIGRRPCRLHRLVRGDRLAGQERSLECVLDLVAPVAAVVAGMSL